MKDFRRLKSWEKAHSLALDVYRATKSFPKEETYGLTAQMRRAAASVPAYLHLNAGTCEVKRMLASFISKLKAVG